MSLFRKFFIFFFLSLMLISMMQPELCPEARIMQNGHQIHGLCARKANSRKAAFWPPMCAKRIMVAYPDSGSFISCRITPPLIQFLTAVIFMYHLKETGISSGYPSADDVNRYFDPQLRAGTLRGPPLSV